MKVKVVTRILEANDRLAETNKKLFAEKGVKVINLMGTPGAGKTTTLARLIEMLTSEMRFGVIEGDIAGTHDAEVIAALGVPVVQINTGGACHLDANMIGEVVGDLPLDAIDVLIVENVGNLVCPAEFKIGEDMKVMVLSVTDGDDKPLKYPLMFQESSVLILNKMDLAQYMDVDVAKLKKDALRLNPTMKIFEVSAKTRDGFDRLAAWLKEFAHR